MKSKYKYVLLLGLTLGANSFAQSQGCINQYSKAMSFLTTNPEKAISELVRSERLCADSPDYEGRSIIQRGVILHISLLKSREALKEFEAFLAKNYATKHKSYGSAVRYQQSLSVSFGEIDDIESQLSANPSLDTRYDLRIRQADISRGPLANPALALEYYKKAYDEVPNRRELTAYMIPFNMAELDLLEDAIVLFEQYPKDFPTGYLAPSALFKSIESRYLIAYYTERKAPRIRAYNLAKKKGQEYMLALNELKGLNPDLIQETRVQIGNILRLIDVRLSEE